jgi:hypothetical protein
MFNDCRILIEDIGVFFKDIWKDWVSLMSGIASLAVWAIPAFVELKKGVPTWSFWLAGLVCLLVCCFTVWRMRYRELQPVLEIVGAARDGDVYQIIVHNLSSQTIRLKAMVTQIGSKPGTPLSWVLRPHHQYEADCADIQGNSDCAVDLLRDLASLLNVLHRDHPHAVEGDASKPGVELMVTGEVRRIFPRDQQEWFLVCVYPCPEAGRKSIHASRWFSLVPQQDGRPFLMPDEPCTVRGPSCQPLTPPA